MPLHEMISPILRRLCLSSTSSSSSSLTTPAEKTENNNRNHLHDSAENLNSGRICHAAGGGGGLAPTTTSILLHHCHHQKKKKKKRSTTTTGTVHKSEKQEEGCQSFKNNQKSKKNKYERQGKKEDEDEGRNSFHSFLFSDSLSKGQKSAIDEIDDDDNDNDDDNKGKTKQDINSEDEMAKHSETKHCRPKLQKQQNIHHQHHPSRTGTNAPILEDREEDAISALDPDLASGTEDKRKQKQITRRLKGNKNFTPESRYIYFFKLYFQPFFRGQGLKSWNLREGKKRPMKIVNEQRQKRKWMERKN